MHKPSISILGPGPDVMLIEGFDCTKFQSYIVVSEKKLILILKSAHMLSLFNSVYHADIFMLYRIQSLFPFI